MAKVLGIGGILVKAQDPQALRSLYRDMLGFEIADCCGTLIELWQPGA
jgi:hypothetical protein